MEYVLVFALGTAASWVSLLIVIPIARKLAAAGGDYQDVAFDAAVVDGRLVTAPAWPAHPAWLARFLELLGTTIQP